MQGTTLSFSNIHRHGELFGKIMKARKPTQLPSNWEDTGTGNHDFDQYDTPQSRWLAIQSDDGDVLASLRLTPTTAQSGVYSYMIRDAQKGLLEEVPKDLLFEDAPVEDGTWEMTRANLKPGMHDVDRDVVRYRLLQQLYETAKAENIAKFVALLPANWKSWAVDHNFKVTPAGRVWRVGGRDLQAHILSLG